jgi:TatD DNase family protein
MKITDIHAHYDDARYEGKEKEFLTELFSKNVETVIGAAVSTDNSRAQISLAEEFSGFYASVGIHPENAKNVEDIEKKYKRA